MHACLAGQAELTQIIVIRAPVNYKPTKLILEFSGVSLKQSCGFPRQRFSSSSDPFYERSSADFLYISSCPLSDLAASAKLHCQAKSSSNISPKP